MYIVSDIMCTMCDDIVNVERKRERERERERLYINSVVSDR